MQPGKLGELLRTLLVMMDIDATDGLMTAHEAVEQEIFNIFVARGTYTVHEARAIATILMREIEVKSPE